MNDVRKGKFGFNCDYVVKDLRVQTAPEERFLESLRNAVLDFSEWQLHIIKEYNFAYSDEVFSDTADNIQKQASLLEKFTLCWKIAK